MAFDRIKNKNIQKTIMSEGPISDLFKNALAAVEPLKYDKEPILRPSGFPTCSILTMARIIEFNKYGYNLQEHNLYSDFFTSVGTTVHEAVQDWTGKTGKLLADWQCVNPECERSKCSNKKCKDKACKDAAHVNKALQVGDKCKECSHPMKYHELEVEYDIITGHVDLITKTGKGKYWAGDYKTSSVKKLELIKAPPINYIYQISSYAWILKYEYDINIEGFSIFYITRDNPGIYKEFSYPFDKVAANKAKKLIDSEIRKYKAAQHAIKTGDIGYAIAAKPCQSLLQFNKLMGDHKKCPFVDVCFGSHKKLEKEINLHLKQFK